MPVFGQCPAGEALLTVSLTTDNWGSETEWTLADSDGTLLLTGGPYQDNAPQTINAPVCVDLGTEVTFTIMDGNGDGICCGSGDGSYSITLFDVVVASGGQFGDLEVVVIPVQAPSEDGANLQELKMGGFLLSGLHSVRTRVKNTGTETLSSVGLSWTEGGQSGTATINGLNVAPGASSDVLHPDQWLLSEGARNLSVTLTAVNGNTDFTSAQTTIDKDITGTLSVGVRQALLEHFTSVNSLPDAVANPEMWAVLSTLTGKVATVSYHTAAGDVFNQANPGDNNARVQFYGASNPPLAVLEGTIGPDQSTQVATISNISAASDVPAAMSIRLDETSAGSQISADVTITPFIDFDNPNLRLFVAMIERNISLTTAPGANGETNFDYVMRKLLPSNQGEPLSSLTAGSPNVNSVSYSVPAGVNIDNLYTVAWIQDAATKKVMQAHISDGPSGSNAPSANDQEDLFTVVDAECGNGTITIGDMPGFSDLTFSWSDSEGKNVGNGPSVSVPPGDYLLTASNDSDFITFDFTVLGLGGAPVISVTDVTYDMNTDMGGATVAVDGPNGPYTITWPNGATGATQTGLTGGDYEVSVKDGNDCEFFVTVSFGMDSGIETIAGIVVSNIYPNPTAGEVNLMMQLADQEVIQVQLLNLNGQLMELVFEGRLEAGEQNLQYSLGQHTPGMYMLRITNGKQQVVQPLVIN